MLDMVQAHDPNLPVILAQGPPSANPQAPHKPGARADLNVRIAKAAEGRKNVTLVDLFTPVATPEGKPIPEYFAADMVHISPAGYQKWLEVLVPVFNQLGLKGTPQP
jgi:lysophospholipase L1-like esterase